MYGPCLSAIVGGRALTPPTRRRLGRPLPHQLADRYKAAPKAGSYSLWTRVHIPYYPVFRRAVRYFWVRSLLVLPRPPLISILRLISVRLACLRHAASVHPEPGSNSQKNFPDNIGVNSYHH